MILIAFTLVGIFLGVRGATKRGGKRLDKVQWGASMGIAFGILGMFVTILFEYLLT